MIYADTNFLSVVEFHDPVCTGVCERFLRHNSRPVVVGELAELEAANVFARVSGHADSAEWRRLQARLDTGEWRREPADWLAIRGRARDLFRRYSHKASLGTLDVLHLAAAQLAGCAHFASFDTGSSARALAAALRLEVFPELSARDRELLTRLKRG